MKDILYRLAVVARIVFYAPWLFLVILIETKGDPMEVDER